MHRNGIQAYQDLSTTVISSLNSQNSIVLEPFDRSPSYFEFGGGGDGATDMCDLGADAGREDTERRSPYLPTLPSSIVVVLNVLPLRCLRENMASD